MALVELRTRSIRFEGPPEKITLLDKRFSCRSTALNHLESKRSVFKIGSICSVGFVFSRDNSLCCCYVFWYISVLSMLQLYQWRRSTTINGQLFNNNQGSIIQQQSRVVRAMWALSAGNFTLSRMLNLVAGQIT